MQYSFIEGLKRVWSLWGNTLSGTHTAEHHLVQLTSRSKGPWCRQRQPESSKQAVGTERGRQDVYSFSDPTEATSSSPFTNPRSCPFTRCLVPSQCLPFSPFPGLHIAHRVTFPDQADTLSISWALLLTLFLATASSFVCS